MTYKAFLELLDKCRKLQHPSQSHPEESLHDAAKWFVAYQFAQQLEKENTRSLAEYIRDGMKPITRRDVYEFLREYADADADADHILAEAVYEFHGLKYDPGT